MLLESAVGKTGSGKVLSLNVRNEVETNEVGQIELGRVIGCPRSGYFAVFSAHTQPHGWYFWGSFIWLGVRADPRYSLYLGEWFRSQVHC